PPVGAAGYSIGEPGSERRPPAPGCYLAGHFAKFWPVDPSKVAKSSTSAQAEALENVVLPAFFTTDPVASEHRAKGPALYRQQAFAV
ncbi:MAG TPA: hypothetical protein VEX11_17810, partial [Acetobacteraceae bacterium]|nr:hypothetical protein [Acetobacteraceae bacterium]